MKTLFGSLIVFSFLMFSPYGLSDQGVEGTNKESTTYGEYGGGSAGQANTAMMSQLASAGQNVATGYAMQSVCTAPPGNPMACAMAKASFIQAGIMLASAFMSGKTRNSAAGGFEVPDLPLNDLYDGYADMGIEDYNGLKEYIDNGNMQMDRMGYTYDESSGNFKLPDGTEIPASEMTPEGIAAATGASPESASLTMGSLAKISNENAKKFDPSKINPNVVGMGFESAGGGGSGSGSYGGSNGDGLEDFFNMMKRKPASATKDQLIAGKSRLLGGESIGVAVDNLFQMVHRRYQAKRKSNTFIEEVVSRPEKR